MIEWVPLTPANLGVGGLLVLFILTPYLLIARGKLIPESTVERMQAGHSRDIEQVTKVADMWRAAFEHAEQARTIEAQRAAQQEELGRLAVQMLSDLRKEAASGPG